MKQNDILWKGLLEDLFDDFLLFFYPDAETIFDFSKGFEFLDKELEDIFPSIDAQNIRYVDKLVKVYHRVEGEKWFLVHVEVQGYTDATFEERMFTYYYRIKDKYQKNITAWAIFTDHNKAYHPKKYTSAFLGTSIEYIFNTYKIIDQDESFLENSNNPFSIIVLTVLLALKKNKYAESDVIKLKLDLVRNLLKKGFSRAKITTIMNFLKYYVRLADNNEQIFSQETDKITGKNHPMGIEQLLLHLAKEEGIEKGIEKGISVKQHEFTVNLLKSTDFDLVKIANLVGVDVSYVEKISREVNL